MSVADTTFLEYHEVQQPSRGWRFYIGDVETLLSHLRSLRFGSSTASHIAVCNVHMFMTARHDEALASALSSASFAVCDGQPIAWLAGFIAGKRVPRITGPDILRRFLLESDSRARVALVGGRPDIRKEVENLLRSTNRTVLILDPGTVPSSGIPDQDTLDALMEFAPDVVFVALGCPKQEKWACAAAQVVPSTFIGVGAAFDYLAGQLRRAPAIMQNTGLEWLYRLIQQPHLFRRYFSTNWPFMIFLLKTILQDRAGAKRRNCA